MPTYTQWIAEQEAHGFEEWAKKVQDSLIAQLKVEARAQCGRGECFPVMLSGKDGDLELSGCVGVSKVDVTDLDKAAISFEQHWSQDWCDTCDEPHRICDFGEGCEACDSDCDCLTETTTRSWSIPLLIQVAPDYARQDYTTWALAILDELATWAWADA